MESKPQWILALYVFVSFQITGQSTKADADGGNSGFISIDCGASTDYVDEVTGIRYQTDEDFIGSGTNYELPPNVNFHNVPTIERQLMTLRSFPEGDRNCYTLKLKLENQEHKYLIRAIFAYENYDYKSQVPIFDLYVGVNYWDTVRLAAANFFQFYDIIIQEVPTGAVQVCLVNTGQGTPFINTLELRPVNNSLYSAPLPLALAVRKDVGSGFARTFTRYKDDVYDRLWFINDGELTDPLKTNAQIKPKDSTYGLPSELLRTASQPLNKSSFSISNWSDNISHQYYLFLHLAEIQKLPPGRKRIINVTFYDENFTSQELTLEYLKPVSLRSNKITKSYASFTVEAATNSDAPPIVNAFEIYKAILQLHFPTDTRDVNAIIEIKDTYGVSRISWQGDPGVPTNLAWDGLSCSSGNNIRILSLNLSSSKLTGQISASFAGLGNLESLDLSNNELTGQLPEFLATLPNLKFINVSGNKLTGSIPKTLREKDNLQLSVADNPGLCQKDSCKKHKFVIPLIASIAVLVLIAILSLMIWRIKKKRLGFFAKSQKMEIVKQKNREFSYFEVLRITNNFTTLIGEGGFGKVYLGTLEDDTQVAVKLLSPSSKQGYKEFRSEAQLLTLIYHRNLVSLVGYCHENDKKALVYEYMDNGDLDQLLSERNPNVLKWNERLQVAVDAAKGLEYLHNGCKTPIIHGDLKPSNILLNKSKLAKIADFGMSRVFSNDRDSHLSTQPAGTPGYIDPEFQRSGNLNKKSDIYSFGMILLQLITGRPPIKRNLENICFILDWVQSKIECGDIDGIVDPRLTREFGVTSAWKIVEISMSCILPTPAQRPDITYVLQELQECLALEMDHATHNVVTSSSLQYGVNCESMTILSAR